MEPQHSEGGQGEGYIEVSFRGKLGSWLQRRCRPWSLGGHWQPQRGQFPPPGAGGNGVTVSSGVSERCGVETMPSRQSRAGDRSE